MDQALDALADRLHDRLLADAGDTRGSPLPERIDALVDLEAGLLDAPTRADLAARVARRSFGLGPLEPLLADPDVDEIMVNGAGRRVWVERAGRLGESDVRFADEAELRHAIERILAPLGRRADEAEPMVDGRLRDGSRVNVVLPPLAVDGPVLTIRRFRAHPLDADALTATGTWTADVRAFLAGAVAARRNIVVSGGTGSGKTTTLNAMSSFIDPGERIVTIEDTAELKLQQPHVVRLEARPPNVEGRGAVTLRDLLRNALRMRPDRIVIGEIRGGEALEMLAAMTTGHDGSLSTVHAGSPTEALRRIETLSLMADIDLPLAAIRDQLADAIHLIVHQSRTPSGARTITTISEVLRIASGPATHDIYTSTPTPTWHHPTNPALACLTPLVADQGAPR
jgi:pilus assembly protein CpaF